MRWAPQHVDPMLSLRNLVCNDRWQEGWQQIATYHHQQRKESRKSTKATKTHPSEPVTFGALEAKGLLPASETEKSMNTKKDKAQKPSEDHPWRQGFWPTKESWRWN